MNQGKKEYQTAEMELVEITSIRIICTSPSVQEEEESSIDPIENDGDI